MLKKVKIVIKLNLSAGEATPAPPVGPALGQHGVAIMEFVKQYNEKTREQKGTILPAVITIFEDRSFEFIVKNPPAAVLLRKAAGIEKGAKTAGREKVGKIKNEQLTQIAQSKLADLNTKDLEAAKRIITGTAKSMGIEVKD